ncbi:DUF2079 domain-containing protein [Sulfobacillus thermosulfidooxidans]|uniref:DUF2079 domain-containing protein n=1 Tax=Sulfobacillus thermosulfidooxidans TaxID=28034 RepID=UPI001494C834|nr:DUF2079 domain-containing protein [Sulfobacillus thermosulfidooxidans]
MTLIVFIIYWTAALIRLYSERATTWDFGYYSQILWLINHGHWLAKSTLNGHDALTDAGSWILYPIGWAYSILHSPGILFLQSAALASGIPFLAWWMKKYPVGSIPFWGILCLYSVYPAVLGSALFDWHPDTLAIPAFFYAAWAIETHHTRHFWLSCMLMLLTKVTAALIIIGLAAPWLLRRQWKMALATFLIGVLLAYVEVDVLFPALAGHQMAQWQQYYGWLGPTPLSGIKNLILHPEILLTAAFRHVDILYILLLGAPLAFLPTIWGLIRGGWAWPAWIMVVFNGLSLFSAQMNAFNQYSLPIAPFWFISLILLWRQLPSRPATFLIPWGLAALSVGLWAKEEKPLIWYNKNPTRALVDCLSKIPPGVPVYGQNSTLATVSSRSVVRFLPLPPRPALQLHTVVILNQNVNPANRLTPLSVVNATLRRLKTHPQYWMLIVHQGPIWVFQLKD